MVPDLGRKPIALLFATSGHSGVDRVVANLLPEFARTTAEFELLTIRNHGPYVGPLPENIRSEVLPVAHRNTIVPALVRYLRRNRPAAVLTASHRLNRAVLLSRVLSRIPCRVAIRMGMSLSALADEMGPRRSRRLFRSMHYWYSQADAVITPSLGVGADLRRYAAVPADRLHVIANPIVTARLTELAAEPIDDPWFSDDARPVILGAGSLEPRKDFATLLRAFASIRASRPCRLVVLGDGRERERLEVLSRELGVSDDVRFPGYAENPYPYMARSAAFVLCSRREGSGAVLVEALACGTPVVAANCPSGPAEILQDGRIGPLVPIGDDAALAAGIERVLDRPNPATELRAAAAPFSAPAAATRYLAALGERGEEPA